MTGKKRIALLLVLGLMVGTLAGGASMMADTANVSAAETSWENLTQGTFGTTYSYSGTLTHAVTYQFHLAAAGRVILTEKVSDHNTNLVLYNESGDELFKKLDEACDNSYTHGFDLTAGDYFFVVKGVNALLNSNVELCWTYSKNTGISKNANCYSFVNLNKAKTETIYEFTGNLAHGRTYRMSLSRAGKITQVASVTGHLAAFKLYDMDGKLLDTQIVNAGNSGTFSYDLKSGVYYFAVEGASAITESAVSTKFSFASAAETYPESQTSDNDTMKKARAVKLNQKITGQLAMNDSADYYKYTISKAGAMKLSVTTKMSAVDLSLVNTAGTVKFNKSNIAKGSHSYTIQGLPKGTYYLLFARVKKNDTGVYTFKANFTVSPNKMALASLKNLKNKKIKAAWKKQSGVTGYQVQISTTSSFYTIVKSKTLTSAKKTNHTFTGLSKRTYYCRIRAYKQSNGIKAYSAWSSAKKIRVKQ